MNILKLSTLVPALALAGWMGCGGGHGTGGTGGTVGPAGSGGSPAGSGGAFSDANADLPALLDAPMDEALGIPDVPPVDTGPGHPLVDCTGLTPAQCHLLIINPPALPDGVLPQDPGPNPAPGYPACSAM